MRRWEWRLLGSRLIRRFMEQRAEDGRESVREPVHEPVDEEAAAEARAGMEIDSIEDAVEMGAGKLSNEAAEDAELEAAERMDHTADELGGLDEEVIIERPAAGAAVRGELSSAENRRLNSHREQLRAVTEEEYAQLTAECQKALDQWKNAQSKLDWVVEANQIDYAIYSLIAAEKRYTSLLREAKQMHRLRLAKNGE